MRFAQIDNGLVTATINGKCPDVCPEGRYFVDITDHPEVLGGESYDSVTDSFTPPPGPTLSDIIQIAGSDKDLVALCGTVARYKNITGWNAMSPDEQVQATLDALEIFNGIRELIDDKI